MVKIYLARGMTGRNKADVVLEANADRLFLESAGFKVLDPVSAEGVKAENKLLQSTKQDMDTYWKRDKQMIEEADVLFDMSPHLKSEGVAHEIGYARYFLYRPIVRVYPLGGVPNRASVVWFEDDLLVDSLEEAIEYVLRVHGTLRKRLMWRIQLYLRCLPKMIRVWMGGWK
jgi:hypothetical protein